MSVSAFAIEYTAFSNRLSSQAVLKHNGNDVIESIASHQIKSKRARAKIPHPPHLGINANSTRVFFIGKAFAFSF